MYEYNIFQFKELNNGKLTVYVLYHTAEEKKLKFMDKQKIKFVTVRIKT